ncbi:MAG: hypothetical protein IH996_10090 [Proteobacteria bacterium]|nr:hypothetical protein [Pseudomonadota bacterium]
MGQLFEELKRRNVVRIGIAYLVMSFIILQILDVIVEPLHLPDWIATFVIVLLAIGLPVALFFSWAYELTSQGVKKTAEVDADASITHSTGRRLDFFIIGALVVALGYFIWDKFGDEPTAQFGEVTPVGEWFAGLRSVAVLPFVNMSSDPEQEYFSDGITEEILNVLVRIEGLRVPSRTSSFAFKGQNINIREVAEVLEVDHILEGSVRKAGNRIRITAQLIHVPTDSHIWAGTFDREYADIFAIQDEIAKAIASALKGSLGFNTTQILVEAPTTNIEAYDLYLKAREYFLTRNLVRMNEAVGLFERAIALDPAFAEAHQGLAALYLVLPDYDDSYDYLETMNKADQMARRALSLDATLAIAHAIVGQGHSERYQWDEANTAFDLAVQHSSNDPTVRLWRGLYFWRLGYLEKGDDEIAAGLKADPASGILNNYMAWSLVVSGRAEEALPYAKKSLGLGYPYAYLSLSYAYLALGNIDEAKRIRQSRSINEEDTALGATMLDLLLNPDERPVIRQRLQALAAEKGIDLQAYMKDSFWCQIEYGDFDTAAETMLQQVTALHWTWSPVFHEYRQSAAFKDMLRRAKIVDYWNANGWPKQCRVLAGDDFECD